MSASSLQESRNDLSTVGLLAEMSANSNDNKKKNEVFVVEGEALSSVSPGEYEMHDSGFEELYLEKSRLISRAIDEIGFGKYQIGLFVVAGFGWFSDNAWPVATSLILPRLAEVDGVHPPAKGQTPFITLAQNLGLLAGALFWSLSSDVIGRRWAFNITFLWTAVWAIVAGSSPNFAALGVFVALWSFGVGGNLPVDSAIFIESLPSKYNYLLTVLSIFWAFGQVVTNLISWGLITNYSCETDIVRKSCNWGWRYFLFTMGCFTFLLFMIRLSFRVFESPRFHMSRGDDEAAVATLHRIAKINGKETSITLQDLKALDEQYPRSWNAEVKDNGRFSEWQIIKNSMEKYNLGHVRAVFCSKKQALSSTLVIFVWAVIGLAFPLYNAFIPTYLAERGNANEPLSVALTYRNTLIIAVMGIPGAILGAIFVETKLGRKGSLALSMFATGAILFGSTTAKTSNANLGWNCGFNIASSIMYGVLYAYTPEIFPTRVRGTGVGLASSANRVLGVFAPIIGMYANLATSAPIFVSGALFLLAGIVSVFFPYESRGKATY
ncbi:LAMI_0B08966g1_1 [Lachancea mirantina]|uniref:LAMI_0B08966g1_1 n=1 Tax=Lachancea mirantina TaxID=1230905 RepID=A0A1G4IYT3_9SACH|nr:LAMI_0B08966g1_1 [Lachancea mirantina]